MTATTRFAFLALVAPLAGCGAIGNGKIATEQRTVEAFSKISIASGIQATLTVGTRDVSLTSDDNILPLVETFLEGDTLVVRVRPDKPATTAYGIRATIANDRIEGLTVSGGSHVDAAATAATNFPVSISGGSTVKVTGIAATETTAEASGGSHLELLSVATTTFTLNGSGGSTLTTTGTATEVHLSVSGATHVDTDAISATTLQLDGSGGSEIKARATGSAKGALSGGTNATISGQPATREVTTSGGSQLTWSTQ